MFRFVVICASLLSLTSFLSAQSNIEHHIRERYSAVKRLPSAPNPTDNRSIIGDGGYDAGPRIANPVSTMPYIFSVHNPGDLPNPVAANERPQIRFPRFEVVVRGLDPDRNYRLVAYLDDEIVGSKDVTSQTNQATISTRIGLPPGRRNLLVKVLDFDDISSISKTQSVQVEYQPTYIRKAVCLGFTDVTARSMLGDAPHGSINGMHLAHPPIHGNVFLPEEVGGRTDKSQGRGY